MKYKIILECIIYENFGVDLDVMKQIYFAECNFRNPKIHACAFCAFGGDLVPRKFKCAFCAIGDDLVSRKFGISDSSKWKGLFINFTLI